MRAKILPRVLLLALLTVAIAGCTISKTASPDTVEKGEQLTFTVTVTDDTGFDPGGGVGIVFLPFFYDQLPDSVRFVSATPPPGGICFVNGGNNPPVPFVPDGAVVCFGPPSAEPTAATYTIDVVATECGTFTNTATTFDSFDPSSPLNQDSADFTVCPQGQEQEQEQEPTCPAISQDLRQGTESGDISSSGDVEGSGANSNQTAGPQDVENTGNQQGGVGVIQSCGSQSGDVELSGSSSTALSPSLDTASEQAVDQSSAGSGQ